MSTRAADGLASRRVQTLARVPHGLPGIVVPAALAVTVVALAMTMNRVSYDIWGALWIGPSLIILSVPIAAHAAHVDRDRRVGQLVIVAAIVKVIGGALARYVMAFGLYGGASDAARYDRVGEVLAESFRHGDYTGLGKISGTRFIEILTGQLYAIVGPSMLGGFMVFSWFAFAGLYLFYRAFRIAYPDGDHKRYAMLVFFFPSLVFWPSSVGKEAVMLLALGAATAGGAQLLAGHFRGVFWVVPGLWVAAIVRPHMAMIVVVSLLVAAPVAILRGGARRDRPAQGRIGGVVVVVGIVIVASTLVSVTQSFFKLDEFTSATASDVRDETTRRSEQGGSEFAPVSPNNPVGFVVATVTVVLRPFPLEVGGVQGLVTAAEGLVLFGLFVASRRRLKRLLPEVSRAPLVAAALAYTFAFVYAFSSLANFGILARQRVQLLPLLLVLVALAPTPHERSAESRMPAPQAFARG